MKKYLLSLFVVLASSVVLATSNPEFNDDSLEITFYSNPGQLYDYNTQQMLREGAEWQSFLAEHGTWYVHFNESNKKPHRAYGSPIAGIGSTPEEMAWNFIEQEMDVFGVDIDELYVYAAPTTKKHEIFNYRQTFEGLTIMNSRVTVKIADGQVIMFGADVFNDIELDINPTLDQAAAFAVAQNDMTNEIVSTGSMGDLQVLAIPEDFSSSYHLVYSVMVKTVSENNIPANYYTLVDAHSGDILYRQNMVAHISSCDKCKKDPKVKTMGMPATMDVEGQVTAEVFPESIIFGSEVLGVPNLSVTIGGTEYFTDSEGNMNFPVSGGNATFELSGPWSKIFTGNDTPEFSMMLNDGDNSVSFDADANIKELSAYRSVNVVHDHCKAIMPEEFTGMDFQIPTNIDMIGECNAFYDGSSINFFAIGGGCNATSQLADVVYHEYGHGINDFYYQSIGGFWINGAMGEGYADYWGITITDNPNLGQGFYTDDENGIRRYDIDPKVYPEDLIGEVHADGEIIMGAWYDTHLLMGADWALTDDLFVQAYAGLQAEYFNGNEGVAYTDVLLDVLQADDDDGDITNGTPNGEAIVEGFDIHGITLVSNATFNHTPLTAAPAEEGIEVSAVILLDFPFINYLDEGKLFYSVNNENDWQEVSMENSVGNTYVGVIPAQPEGTIIEYYLGLVDTFGSFSNVKPTAANTPDPNLPYYILVGLEEISIHDSDFNQPWGEWETGVSGDNNTTGDWEVNIPIGSFSSDGVLVAPNTQTTDGGEFCFLTGQSSSSGAGIGENDIDGGHTTLRSPVIDLTGMDNPVFTYMRYYVNAPPSGANPGQDWWQVQVSDDGGSSWIYLENSRTQDMSWRRNAFRVQDYVDVTDEFMIQMIASDSTFVGQNLDGGSLVEAAVDDIILWDLATPDNINELVVNDSFNVYPNPAKDNINIEFELAKATRATMEITDMTGRSVIEQELGELFVGKHRKTIPTKSLPAGMYVMTVRLGGDILTQSFQMID